MKILFVVPYVPNLIRVRPYNLLRTLSEKGHSVTLLTLWSNPDELKEAENLRNIIAEVNAFPLERWRIVLNCLKTLPSHLPLQMGYAWHPGLSQKLEELTRLSNGSGFDVLHIEHLRGARYGLHYQSCPTLHESGSLPVIWDSVDSISLLFRQASSRSKRWISRWITQFELSRTEYCESWLPRQFDKMLVTSPSDRRSFLELAQNGGRKIESMVEVVPNGVDLKYFSPDLLQRREPATLVISGKMSYHANVSMVLEFADHVMPLIWRHRPAVQLAVVGKDPPPEITSLAKDPRVHVTGTVNDIRPYLRTASIAVAPLTYGVGIQNKVLEAMACETPVVSSAQAISALQAVPNRDVIVASTWEEMAKKILYLLDDPNERRQVGRSGRQYVERHHRWDVIVDHLLEVYDEAIRIKHTPLQKTGI